MARLWTYFHAVIYALLACTHKLRFVLKWQDIDDYINFVTGPYIGRHPSGPPLHLVISAERESRRAIHHSVRRQARSMSQAMTDVQGNTALWNWHFFQPWQEWQNKQLMSGAVVGGGRSQAPGGTAAVPTDGQGGKGRRALRTAKGAARVSKSEGGKAKGDKGSAKAKGKSKKKQTCYAYNNEGCTDTACERTHKCWFCSGDHPGPNAQTEKLPLPLFSRSTRWLVPPCRQLNYVKEQNTHLFLSLQPPLQWAYAPRARQQEFHKLLLQRSKLS